MTQNRSLHYRLYRLRRKLTSWLPALVIVAVLAGIALFVLAKSGSPVSDSRVPASPPANGAGGDALLLVPRGEREATFEKALQLAKSAGSLDQASALMRRLAPTQGAVNDGYAPAHLWVAEQIFVSRETAEGSSLAFEEMEAVGEHLRRAVELDPKVGRAHDYLMSYYFRRGERERALAVLESGVAHFPEMGLTLALLLKEEGSLERASERAQAAVLHFRELALSHPDEPLHRLRWAQGEMLQDHFDTVLAIAERGQALHEEENGYRELLRAAYLALVDRNLKAKPLDLAAVFEQVALLVGFDRDHPQVVAKIGELCSLPETAVRAKPILAEMRKSEDAPALTHRLLGDLEAKAGRLNQAMALYREAIAKEATHAVAKNNLAWCLKEQDPPQLDKALIMVDEAIADQAKLQSRVNPSFFETRGQILLKAERFDEAVTELERALRFMPEASKLKVHQSLATAYGKLGLTDLSETHGRLAKAGETTTQS